MRIVLALLSFVSIADAAPAAVFTNGVSVDSFVRAATPALNYGGAGALSVSGPNAKNGMGISNGVFDSFIRFNTAALVTNFNSLFGTNNWIINDAKLRVTELGAPANALFDRGIGSFEIRWITNGTNWIEGTGTPNAPTADGITYNDELALLNSGMDATLGRFTNSGVNTALSFPLTLAAAFVSDVRGGGEVGLYLTASDPGVGFTFDSRGFGTVSARPFLEISAVPKPGIAGITFSGRDVILASTNGVAGGTYYVLRSTTVTLPMSDWLPVATNILTVNGNFAATVTNGANVNGPGPQFFVLQTP